MIKRKLSLSIIFNEKNGQKYFFGRDDLSSKATNMSNKKSFDNTCAEFKLKKLIKNKNLFLSLINIT